MPYRLTAALLAALACLAACSTAADSSSAGATQPTTADVQNGCVDMPPISLESCRRSGMGGHSGSGSMSN